MAAWVRCFTRADQLLCKATVGQVRFGRVSITDNLEMLGVADFVLHGPRSAGQLISYATGDPYTDNGAVIHLINHAKNRPLTIVHELGHALWGLGDSFVGPTWKFRTSPVSPAAFRAAAVPVIMFNEVLAAPPQSSQKTIPAH